MFHEIYLKHVSHVELERNNRENFTRLSSDKNMNKKPFNPNNQEPNSISSDSISDAIKLIGAEFRDMIDNISFSTDLDERHNLAFQLQSRIVDHLNKMGFNAHDTDSSGIIRVNGQCYDIIHALNSPGISIELQALIV